MARLSVVPTVRRLGFDECVATFASVSEAAANAHLADLIEIESIAGGLTFNGTQIVAVETTFGNPALIAMKPAAGMILFIGWLMTELPSYATVEWVRGWPIVRCPPRDDRDPDEGPAPRVPGLLEPA